MANLPHGRGKQSFREFNRSLKDEIKDIKQSIEDDEEITANDVHRFLDRLVNEYVQHLRAEELDVETWSNRAVDKAYQAAEKIISDFGLNEEPKSDDNQEPEPDEREQPLPDGSESDGQLFGHPLLTKETKQEARAKAKPRRRFFTTLDELETYVEKVPYIMFIQIVRGSEGVIYRVWVEAAKDKKKRKSAS